MHKLFAAVLCLVPFVSCVSSAGSEAVTARKLGISVADARALKAKKNLTDADLLAMPAKTLEFQVHKLHAPSNGHPRAAAEWRLLTLRDENGQVPPNAMMDAKQQMEALAGGDGTAVGGLEAANWTDLGPSNIGGRTRAIAIHPTTTTTLFAGSVAGGIWRSTNSGTSWSRVGTAMTNLAITQILFTPGNPTEMWASTGEGFDNPDGIRGAGIWKSVDSGSTWTQLAATNNSNFYFVNSMAISPNGLTLLAATGTGMYRSTNGGLSFSFVAATANSTCFDVDFHPTDNNRAVAHIRDYDFGIGSWYSTVMYSTNGGASWTQLAGAIRSNGYFDRIELAFHRGWTGAAAGCIYAQKYVDSTATTQLFRSIDGGASYVLVSTNTILATQGWYDNSIWVDPSDTDAVTADDVVVVGGIDVYRSTNGGASFTKVSEWFNWPTSAHADHHRIVEHPGFNGTTNRIVYFGNDGGIWRTNDIYSVATLSGWTNLNNGYSVTQFYGGSRHAASGILIGGTQDNGTLRTTGSLAWSTMFGGDGGFCASDPTDSNYHYGEYVNLQIHRSTNGGVSSSSIYGPISGGNFIAPFVLDPNNANTMIAGGDSLWRSTNVKAGVPSWTVIKAATGTPISAIAVAPGNSALMYIGDNNGNVYKTTNGTAVSPTWTQIDNNPTALPNRYVTRITIDPANTNRVFVTFGGFATNNAWVSTNGGSNWSALAGLPNAPVRDLEIHPVNANWFYVATEVGLLVSENGGVSWSSAVTPASVSIDEMFWSGNYLYLATHGLGMFRQTPFTVASAVSVGSACTVGGALTGPTLSSSLPKIGTTWSWTLIGAQPNSFAVLYVTGVPPAPTQVSPGCFAQFDLAASTSLPSILIIPASGVGVWTLVVPNNLTLAGLDFMSQAATVLWPTIVLSNGRQLTVGL